MLIEENIYLLFVKSYTVFLLTVLIFISLIGPSPHGQSQQDDNKPILRVTFCMVPLHSSSLPFATQMCVNPHPPPSLELFKLNLCLCAISNLTDRPDFLFTFPAEASAAPDANPNNYCNQLSDTLVLSSQLANGAKHI